MHRNRSHVLIESEPVSQYLVKQATLIVTNRFCHMVKLNYQQHAALEKHHFSCVLFFSGFFFFGGGGEEEEMAMQNHFLWLGRELTNLKLLDKD